MAMVMMGLGALVSGATTVYSAVKGDEARDEQRKQMAASEERQNKLDAEAKQKVLDEQKSIDDEKARSDARQAAKARTQTTRKASVLTSPLAQPVGSSSGGGGGKTLLGM